MTMLKRQHDYRQAYSMTGIQRRQPLFENAEIEPEFTGMQKGAPVYS